MGLRLRVDQIWLDRQLVAYRAPANYAIGAHTIFTIQGGPVWIKAIFARFTAAEASGSTFALTVGGVAMQNAAVNVNGAINTLATFPLGAAAGQVIVPAVLAQPPFSLANALLGQVGQGQIASPGNIVLTVAAALTDGLPEFYVVYQKLQVVSNIAR